VKGINLQKIVMDFIGCEWTTSKELAESIAIKYPEDFKKPPFHGDVSALSMALGPSLYALANRGMIEHNGTQWPATKRWRKVQSKEKISVNVAAEALIKLHLAVDHAQAIRMLAARALREHEAEFEELIKQAQSISEESIKIGKRMLGLSK